jgi:hypothetical protein
MMSGSASANGVAPARCAAHAKSDPTRGLISWPQNPMQGDKNGALGKIVTLMYCLTSYLFCPIHLARPDRPSLVFGGW